MGENFVVLLRILAAVVGAYGLTAVAVAVLPLPLVQIAGMPPGDAVMLSSLLGILLYLVLGLWAFAAAKSSRMLLVLGGGALTWLLLLSHG